MARLLLSVCAIFACSLSAFSQIIEMGPGKTHNNLESACQAAQPGDTILIYTGIYNNDDYIEDLHGTPNAWISIKAALGNTVTFSGGTQAFQMSDPRYVYFSGLNFEKQTGNGVNIDDGGSYDSPAQYIVFDNCHWKALSASGNNDQLKMSGVNNIIIKNCSFTNGSAGGSMVDMVGCHDALFENNTFESGGSNCIQTKGGSKDITIIRNKFINGGQRAINIGGSTDLQYFRPSGASTEASNIFVYANIFEGAQAALAFVGAVNCMAINNTIITPASWAVRILQENTEPGILQCSNNTIRNNIFVLTNTDKPAFNIGGNTKPETFTCSNNLWYKQGNSSWPGPNTPVAEPGVIINLDPLLDIATRRPAKNSPAIGKGFVVSEPVKDYYNVDYKNPPTIGAAEYEVKTASNDLTQTADFLAWPNPVTSSLTLRALNQNASEIRISDTHGRQLIKLTVIDKHQIDTSEWPVGIYFIQSDNFTQKIIKQ